MQMEAANHTGQVKDIDPSTVKSEKLNPESRQYIALKYMKLRANGRHNPFLNKMMKLKTWSRAQRECCLKILKEMMNEV